MITTWEAETSERAVADRSDSSLEAGHRRVVSKPFQVYTAQILEEQSVSLSQLLGINAEALISLSFMDFLNCFTADFNQY